MEREQARQVGPLEIEAVSDQPERSELVELLPGSAKRGRACRSRPLSLDDAALAYERLASNDFSGRAVVVP